MYICYVRQVYKTRYDIMCSMVGVYEEACRCSEHGLLGGFIGFYIHIYILCHIIYIYLCVCVSVRRPLVFGGFYGAGFHRIEGSRVCFFFRKVGNSGLGALSTDS